jgi:hypothetical protein
MAEKRIRYKASPTAAEFHKSTKPVRGFRGPVGSGKTVACVKEIMRLCKLQWPNVEKKRLSRWAIIRNTTPELRTTTLNTFSQWIPEEICPITYHPVIMGNLEFPMSDGTRVEAEILFLALDQEKDVRKLLSLEVSGVFINEAREISFSVLKAARERIGRYPSWADMYDKSTLPPGTEHPCRQKSVIMDTNPPSDDHWWYQLAENGYLDGSKEDELDFHREETERIFDFVASPSPLIKQKDGTYIPNPRAENIAFLPGGYDYYLDMVAGNTEDHINVMVLGNYGNIKTGKPVYPEYNDLVHSTDIRPNPNLPLGFGWDFGLTPTLVIGQMTSLGQLRVLDELVGRDLSVRAFARDIVKPHLSKHYAGFEIAFSLGDPSGNNRGEGEGKSAIGILNDDYVQNDDGDIIAPLNMGFTTEPAPTNDITLRLESVKGFLTKMVDAGEPGYQLDKKCQYLRKGKQGQYKYKRLQVAGSPRYNEKPDKNDYSHPADAEQYLALGFTNGYDYGSGSTETYYEDDDIYESDRDAVGGY